ncbi:MAG TPA: hypothetical protein PK702_12745, partial [Burkholderiaceae bacterium]|nr:hypothetical protein [Burkholderiaceae bacterium]
LIASRISSTTLSATLPADKKSTGETNAPDSPLLAGKKCPDCGAHALIRKDGCEYCTQCGYLGSCG